MVGVDDVLDKIRHVFASLYNDRAISYRVHKGYAHAEVALSAGIQRMVRSDKGSAGVDVHHRHRVGLPGRGVHHLVSTAWARRWCRAPVNPDEYYVFKPALERGNYPIVSRRIGSKLIKMEFDPERPEGRAVRTVDVPVSERNRYSLTDDEVIELALRGHHREALPAPDGHRVGPRRRGRQDLHPAGASGNGEIAAGRQ